MCIPPINTNSEKYFSQLNNLSRDLKVNELSMGMSADYLAAIKFEATFLRLGSSIFGTRKS